MPQQKALGAQATCACALFLRRAHESEWCACLAMGHASHLRRCTSGMPCTVHVQERHTARRHRCPAVATEPNRKMLRAFTSSVGSGFGTSRKTRPARVSAGRRWAGCDSRTCNAHTSMRWAWLVHPALRGVVVEAPSSLDGLHGALTEAAPRHAYHRGRVRRRLCWRTPPAVVEAWPVHGVPPVAVDSSWLVLTSPPAEDLSPWRGSVVDVVDPCPLGARVIDPSRRVDVEVTPPCDPSLPVLCTKRA